ncbi:MAG: hypothetical protein WC712_06010 [Candidatus Brocadiia bacterium]
MRRWFFRLMICVALSLLWLGFSASNFAEQAELALPNIQPKFANEGEILAAYRTLLAAPIQNGSLDPRRVLVAGIADLAYDRAGAECRGAPLSIYTLAEFKSSFLPGLEGLVAAAAQDDAELKLAIELVINGVAWSFFNSKPIDNYLAVQAEIVDFVRNYRLGEKKGEINTPLLRQALATAVVGLKHDAPNYDSAKYEAGGAGIFLLQKLDDDPVPRTKGQDNMDYNWRFPIHPLVAKGTGAEGQEVSVSGEYHVFANVAHDGPIGLAFEGLQAFGYTGGAGEGSPFINRYFQGPAFLQRFYGQCIFNAPIVNDDPDSPLRVSSDDYFNGSPMFADPRAIRIEQKFTFSRDVFKLVDTRNPAYSQFVRWAVMGDRLNVPLTGVFLDRMTDAERKEFSRYRKYIVSSHAFLVAWYPRTWTITCTAKSGDSVKNSAYRLPDYSAKPRFGIVFLPQEWTVIAARAGLDVVLYNLNLMGIGDRRLIFGEPKYPARNEEGR